MNPVLEAVLCVLFGFVALTAAAYGLDVAL